MLGSYGGLPILSMSPNDSEEHHVTSTSRRGKRKGKSKLANNQPVLFLDDDDDDLTQEEPFLTTSFNSRRRTRDESCSSRILGEEVDGQEERRFETHLNTSALDPSTISHPLLDSSEASFSSTRINEDDLSDESDLHDAKGNPSDNSPYAQVRASVAATDNTSLSIDTPRMWVLSTVFSIAGSSTNLFFSLRYPSVTLTPIIALLLVHPLGLLWDQILKRSDDPDQSFVDGCLQGSLYTSQSSHQKIAWKRQLRLWLAQGRWNEKEHCCVYVSSNVSFGFAFATDVCTLYDKYSSRILIWDR